MKIFLTFVGTIAVAVFLAFLLTNIVIWTIVYPLLRRLRRKE